MVHHCHQWHEHRKYLPSWCRQRRKTVGVRGNCSVGSVGASTCWPTIYADESGSSLLSLKTEHAPTWFAWLERCCCVVIRVVCVWLFVDELERDFVNLRSFAQCPFRPLARHSVFAFSSSIRRRRSSLTVTDVTGEQDICPCLYLCLHLCLSPFQRKGKLAHSLVQIVHSLQGQDHRPTCRQDEQLCPIQVHSNIIQSNIR